MTQLTARTAWLLTLPPLMWAGNAVVGRLMVGSLELLARTFPDSRLRLDGIGALFGEPGLGVAGQAMTGALEGALFAACVVGTMAAAARRSAPRAVRPDAAAGR